jgi:hypothetical protein
MPQRAGARGRRRSDREDQKVLGVIHAILTIR